MTIRSRSWERANTYSHSAFSPDRLAAERESTVSICLPARNEARTIGPILEQMSGEMQGKLTVAKINIDENPMVPSKYGIRSIPTLIMFKDGKPAAQKIGAEPKARLAQWIQSVL